MAPESGGLGGGVGMAKPSWKRVIHAMSTWRAKKHNAMQRNAIKHNNARPGREQADDRLCVSHAVPVTGRGG